MRHLPVCALGDVATPGRFTRAGARWDARLDRPMYRQTALRVDVDLPGPDLHHELAQLQARLEAPERPLGRLDPLVLDCHGLDFRIRQADGDYFIYVTDPVPGRLVGYIVLSRLVEVNRRADRYLRSPHAKVAQSHRRMGITSTVYRWWLDRGHNLMSGERQSPEAHRMWSSLSRDYRLIYVRLQDKRVTPIDGEISDELLGSLGTRMVLMGRGCDPDRFVH